MARYVKILLEIAYFIAMPLILLLKDLCFSKMTYSTIFSRFIDGFHCLPFLQKKKL